MQESRPVPVGGQYTAWRCPARRVVALCWWIISQIYLQSDSTIGLSIAIVKFKYGNRYLELQLAGCAIILVCTLITMQAEYQKVALKENLWFMEKKELTEQLRETEGRLAAAEAVNNDLKHKNNMLEHCLRQMKLKSNPPKEGDEPEPLLPIPQRRPKSNKPHISKILCSLGVTNLIEEIGRDLKAKLPANNLKIEIPAEGRRMQNSPERAPAIYKEISHLEDHQDGVRDICFLNDRQYLVSVSEDSTMKLWNIEQPKEKIQCVMTVRQHAGPIFTAVEGDGLLFTGGMEGIVRCWNFPRKMGGQAARKCMIGHWNNSEDQKLQPIWQLFFSPEKKMLFSTSSEVAIRCFQLDIAQTAVSAKYRASYVYQSKNNEEEDIPTAICMHQSLLVAGYVNNNFLVEFDLQTQKPLTNIQFQADGQISTNRITSNGSLLAGAFDDAMVRIFDRSKLVHSFEAHEESVMSLCFTQNPYELFTCGQDGAVKLWDMRKYTKVCSFNAHKRKYDEAGHCISSGKGGLVASGGADGVIKVYGC